MRIRVVEDYTDSPVILGSRLMTAEEATSLLKRSERVYKDEWWLGSIYPYDDRFADICESNGKIDTMRGEAQAFIRPVLILRDVKFSNYPVGGKKSLFKKGNLFQFGGKEFKILTNTLAWMYNDDIGEASFNSAIDYIESWYNKSISNGDQIEFPDDITADMTSVDDLEKIDYYNYPTYGDEREVDPEVERVQVAYTLFMLDPMINSNLKDKVSEMSNEEKWKLFSLSLQELNDTLDEMNGGSRYAKINRR